MATSVKELLPEHFDGEVYAKVRNNPEILKKCGYLLHYACFIGDGEEITELICNGSDINSIVLGASPLEFYMQFGDVHMDIVQFFLDKPELQMQNLAYQYKSIPAVATHCTTEIARKIFKDQRSRFTYKSFNPFYYGTVDYTVALYASYMGNTHNFAMMLQEFPHKQLHLNFISPDNGYIYVLVTQRLRETFQ